MNNLIEIPSKHEASKKGYKHSHNPARKPSKGKHSPVAKKSISNNSALRWYLERAKES